MKNETSAAKSALQQINEPSFFGVSDKDIELFLTNPNEYFGHSLTRMMSLPAEVLSELQLRGLKRRFAQFRDAIPMLQRLIDAERIDAITNLDDALPLLFDHATYKSYPASLLEKCRFDVLTQWLQKLTTIDLSRVDASRCRSVDDWMETLKRETPLSLCHTSGTSGTISFLPWTKDHWRKFIGFYPVLFFQKFGEDAPPYKIPLNIPCIYPYFRDGGSAHTLINDYVVEIIAGNEDNFHVVYPGRVSSDVLLLAAKRRAAVEKGSLDQLQVSPEIEARRAEFEAQQRNMPQQITRFFATAASALAGKEIFMLSTATLLISLAESGLKQGLRSVFSPASHIVTGGGGKGVVLPEDWQETVKEFFGVDRINMAYGMSEMTSSFAMCEHGHYHVTPWIIPYILDGESGKPLARTGTVTGRFAFYDLMAAESWGGFITGDEVTLTWDVQCPCGQKTPYLDDKIQRFSEKTNDAGEEKITCAATSSAYKEALDFLNQDAL